MPLTLQPMAILAIGFSCHPSLAIASVIAYILEGSLGLPVFQRLSGGLPYLLGPTGGYIIGFLPLVTIASYYKGNKQTYAHLFKIGLLAKFPLFALGVLWLSSFVGMNAAIKLGFLLFLLKIPVEIAFAILTSRLAKASSQYLLEKIQRF